MRVCAGYSIAIALPDGRLKKSKEVYETRTVDSFAGFLLSIPVQLVH